MTSIGRILVIGASVAAGALVGALRAAGHQGPIVLVDCDPDAPYDRPPLSKDFPPNTEDRPPAPWWVDDCELVRGRAVTLNVAASRVEVETSVGDPATTIEADHVVVATGCGPARLPDEPDGVLHLRTAADARKLRELTGPRRSVIVLGAGTIGTELSSSLIDRGCAVTLVDYAELPLERFLGGHLGAEAASWIAASGTRLRLGTKIERIQRKDDGWTVDTSAGRLEGDVLISAVGARPNTGWLQGSDLDAVDGIRCDRHGSAYDRAGNRLPHIHAIGDVASWEASSGANQRFENWTTAGRQGRHLAQHLLGRDPGPIDAEPAYFWSHQFGRRIQVLGTPVPAATLVQHVDDPERSAAFYTLEQDGTTRAWISINRPRDFALALRAAAPATS